ncbi:MAG: adenylyl-sulfate kinase [SAR202 cluster bacterium]|nr:adenylyl-sulfate kinase [SAR202 cluster bacterium]
MTALVAWMTGLSGAGKSTIAEKTAALLEEMGNKVLVLDGDAVRSKISPALGFTREDILENDRRLISLCLEAVSDYDVILVPKISPFKEQRAVTRQNLGEGFVEVYVRASIETVSTRDPKGLYKDSREGRLKGLIGVAPEVPYEPPESPELVLDTETSDPDSCARTLCDHLLAWRS